MALSSLHGVFPVLKPTRITSAHTLNYIKKKLQTEMRGGAIHDGEEDNIKMGHGGTLDLSASGVLAVGVGEGCKKLKCFLHGEKTYIATCQLGVATDTYNDKGEVTMEKPYEHVTEKVMKRKLNDFLGRIKQVPPAFSALKKDGKRYSDWTREGVILERTPRLVYCYELELTDFDPPFFTLSVVSGSGFYVRSLIHDLGCAVGSCAHLTGLERTKQGPLSLRDALTEHQWTLDAITSSIVKHRHSINKYYSSYELTTKTHRW